MNLFGGSAQEAQAPSPCASRARGSMQGFKEAMLLGPLTMPEIMRATWVVLGSFGAALSGDAVDQTLPLLQYPAHVMSLINLAYSHTYQLVCLRIA